MGTRGGDLWLPVGSVVARTSRFNAEDAEFGHEDAEGWRRVGASLLAGGACEGR
jgi:hypothetical protein